MANYLVLQVLGNNDIKISSDQAKNSIQKCKTFEDFHEEVDFLEELMLEDIEQVKFPLIRKVYDRLQKEANIHFGIILTNQQAWIEHHNISGQTFSDLMASDGYWWRNILSQWCQAKNINLHLIHLEIQPELENGVANWDGMAKTIENLLSGQENPMISFKNQHIIFQPPNSDKITFDKFIIQHSSGTPALSSALYLWGVEQKIAGQQVEFVYISRQDTSLNEHSGDHWQWRLKVPQIQQLLEIQDFAGALKLITENEREQTRNKLKQLDRAVSFNLFAKKTKFSSPKDEIIERIAIALWSEQAFRDRGQWMHWYLRVAGAFELAIFCLVECQGSGKYYWERTSDKVVLKYRELNQQEIEFRLEIKSTVKLLSQGSYLERNNYHKRQINYQVNSVSNVPDWTEFKIFYCKNWLQGKSFLSLRNELYHTLMGDAIDKYLDEETDDIGTVKDSKHSSQIAIDWLNYIVNLANLSTEVEKQVKDYENLVAEIKRTL
ncbi:hypothetical protein [Lyngbya sp. PCC 8106]|uniref:hypothetical protein n=1 Tax=Lyngbya sp. (strain PCC 8106) TaxID=313612 RepID=UPI0000EA9EC9|nr:hypothetical protein [Lyngbya sp. PCC 8106]EAW36774.1 hypothetical protein L8106_30020 [Lyngbya sp. PCC 8106]